MKKLLLIISVVLTMTTLFSCSNSGSSKKEAEKLPELKGKWTILSVYGNEIKSEKTPFIEFADADRVHCQLPCNIFNTTITHKEGTNELTFNQGQMTMMTCPDYASEDALVKALNSTVTFNGTDKEMQFLNQNGEAIVTLKK